MIHVCHLDQTLSTRLIQSTDVGKYHGQWLLREKGWGCVN